MKTLDLSEELSEGERTEVRVYRRRTDGKPVMAEWRIAGRVDDQAILTYNAAGELVQLARFDEAGDISSVRTYDPPGKRYTARNLDGSNALDGCGAMDLALDPSGRELYYWNGRRGTFFNGGGGRENFATRFEVVQNWFQELERLVPTDNAR